MRTSRYSIHSITYVHYVILLRLGRCFDSRVESKRRGPEVEKDLVHPVGHVADHSETQDGHALNNPPRHPMRLS